MRKLAVLGDMVVSMRPLDGGERRELRAAARRRLRGLWGPAVIAGIVAAAAHTQLHALLIFAIPLLLTLPGAFADGAAFVRLIGDARAGQVLVFASGGGRSERLAGSGQLWSEGEAPAPWRST